MDVEGVSKSRVEKSIRTLRTLHAVSGLHWNPSSPQQHACNCSMFQVFEISSRLVGQGH